MIPGLRRPAVALAGGLLVACGATPNRDSTPPRPEPPLGAVREAAAPGSPRDGTAETGAAGPRVLVARVAGDPIGVEELIQQLLRKEGVRLRDELEELIVARLVRVEAERLGLSADERQVDRNTEAAITELEAEVRQDDPQITFDRFVRGQLGLDPIEFRRRIRLGRELDWLATRCVRTWLFSNERAEVRVIVVESREAADQVGADLAAGKDFAEIARAVSVHESSEQGGAMPPVVRSDAALARLAFSTPVGQVGGPVFEQGSYLFLRVDGRAQPVSGSWAEVGAAVEASLEERTIEDPEYWQWKAAMQDRYEVDMQPFLDLAGDLIPADAREPSQSP